jgi:glutathione synthase/RimK-type ligase-like ATP-grasp enzyme
MDRLLIVGDPEDLNAVYLGWVAERRGLDVIILDEARFGLDWYVVKAERQDVAIVLETGVIVIDAASCGIAVRLNPRPGLPSSFGLAREQELLYLHERRSAIEFVLNTVAAPVANRPSCGRSNNSKPYQMTMLADQGFDVPTWIVTNHLEPAQRFADSHPLGCVYKACSGLRSRVRRFDDHAAARLGEQTSPIVLQKYVEGMDARVHVAGSRVYTTTITAAGTDYRFEAEGATYAPAKAPDDVGRACVTAARAEGLVVAGIDFRVDRAGRWWCLELNPVPTFLPYEASSGQAIAEGIIDALAELADERSP